MSAEQAEFDDQGNWLGVCDNCGTNHDGFPPDTFGAVTRCLRLQAEALGASHLVDQVDAAEAHMRRYQEQALRDLGLIP